ncbi:hypothetical protein [Paraburkholderia azotifigens]|uniref:Flagellar protein FliT n=1 Tax=Paraburkholderia azotifigens TaxID=2057004 RepID=A0A5C6V6P7_9BURK|nr:hypothetical protein [Paraburkholderia azotifigens]TXC80261.1 hypothetical protein FRZ40_38885 [Paraburkholderia azotifigens]
MNKAVDDVLAEIINVSADLRGRLSELDRVECMVDGILSAPWLEQARTIIRTELMLLSRRKQDLLAKLEALRLDTADLALIPVLRREERDHVVLMRNAQRRVARK